MDSIQVERVKEVEHLYLEDGPRLWRALRLSTGRSDVADDALAEAYAQLLGTGSVVRNPRAWVWKVAFRVAASEMKVAGRSEQLPEDLPGRTPSSIVDLEQALRRLTPHQRTSVLLADNAGWSHGEIADALESTRAAVAVHLHRARRKLRVLMEVSDEVP